eukprot:359362-Chlamydomonas_euryale.AAC.4
MHSHTRLDTGGQLSSLRLPSRLLLVAAAPSRDPSPRRLTQRRPLAYSSRSRHAQRARVPPLAAQRSLPPAASLKQPGPALAALARSKACCRRGASAAGNGCRCGQAAGDGGAGQMGAVQGVPRAGHAPCGGGQGRHRGAGRLRDGRHPHGHP